MAKRKHGERVSDRFVFRQNDHIGSVDAAADSTYLRDCFVDTGLIEVILDFDDHRQLVTGRTGAGKTALLEYLSSQSYEFTVLPIPAEGLALNHISNSTILTFVRQLGVNLDIFFKLLWRHVFAIEILKSHFKITDETKKRTFIQKLADVFKNSNHRRAIEYLEQWGGGKFWLDTDNRIKEITRTLENELKTSLQGPLPGAGSLEAGWIRKATDEQRVEVAQRAQNVVNKVQMQELSWVIDLINDRLEISGASFLILIDRLDESWIEDEIRYLLIRSLIETIRDFLKVARCKILVAIRQDLVDRVFEKTRDKHFQEEKYKNLFLDIRWSPAELRLLIDNRLGKLVKRKYENVSATFSDLFPKKIASQDTFEYLLDRTLMRPRDVIHFVNLSISRAANTALVTKAMFLEAEAEYSKDRLNFLYDEWRADYPDLKTFVHLLKNRQAVVGLAEISDADIEAVAVELSGTDVSALGALAVDAIERGSDSDKVRVEMALVLYRVGIVGLKPASYERVQWRSTEGRISKTDVSKTSKMYIHPMGWRALGTRGVET